MEAYGADSDLPTLPVCIDTENLKTCPSNH